MMRVVAVVLLLACSGMCASAQESGIDASRIRLVVERMLESYPESTLQDIYKSFFQDRFGPGHMVADTTAAVAYIKKELSEVDNLDVILYEQVGDRGEYYRVALAAVAAGKVPFGVYVSAFLNSVRDVPSVDIEAWACEWDAIEMVISSMNLDLPDYEKDAAKIRELLAKGFYAVHHSKAYNVAYSPHYRIVKREIFMEKILPLLE